MRVTSLSRRYAKALFEVALEHDVAGEVASELAKLGSLVKGIPHVVELLSSPTLSSVKKEELLSELVYGSSLTTYTANFLKVLVDNGRFRLIFEIIRGYQEAEDEHKGIREVEITTPFSLSEGEKKIIFGNLKKVVGEKIRIKERIDPEIVGGIIIRVGSTVYDGSITHSMERMRRDMIAQG